MQVRPGFHGGSGGFLGVLPGGSWKLLELEASGGSWKPLTGRSNPGRPHQGSPPAARARLGAAGTARRISMGFFTSGTIQVTKRARPVGGKATSEEVLLCESLMFTCITA